MKKFLAILFASSMLVPVLAFADMPSISPGNSIMAHIRSSSKTGTVSSVSGTSITMAGTDSTTYTVDASAAKIMRKFGASISVGDIKAGDSIMVVGAVSGTNISAKMIRDNSLQQKNGSLSGSVTAVSGASFTLQSKNRGSQTVNTSASTTFKEAGMTSVSMSNVTVGENVVASGVWDSASNTVTASSVTIVVKISSITGSLTAVSGSTLTVIASGTTPTVYNVDASNVKKVDRRFGASTDLAALQVGDILNIRGVVNGTNVQASTIRDMSLQARYGTFVGTVSAVSSPSFTLQSKDRGSQTINTTSTTIFKQGSLSVVFANLAVGQTVTVSGVWDRTNSNVTANRVTIKVSSTSVTGTVSNISGMTFTVTASTTPYSVDGSKATFLYKNGRKGSISMVQANDQLLVRGQMVSGSTSITASLVRDMSQTYVKPVAVTPSPTPTPAQ